MKCFVIEQRLLPNTYYVEHSAVNKMDRNTLFKMKQLLFKDTKKILNWNIYLNQVKNANKVNTEQYIWIMEFLFCF